MKALERRLRRAVLIALGTPLAACGSSSSDAATPADTSVAVDGARDTTTGIDAVADAASDADGTTVDTAPIDPACLPVFDDELSDECTLIYSFPCGFPPDYPLGFVDSLECLDICPPNDGGLPFLCNTAIVPIEADTGGEAGEAGEAGEVGDASVDDAETAGSIDAGSGDVGDGGMVARLSCTHCATGRRPPGLAPTSRARRVPRERASAQLFAQIAELEAASIAAFATLARELRAHGAPKTILAQVDRSRRDEIRHAWAMARVSRRLGVAPRLPSVRRPPTRDLVSLAKDNAAEGCVRETFGAAIALFQAERAAEPRLRAVLRRIADDETRHADVSRRIAAWAHKRLGAAARREVKDAERAAIARLRAEVAAGETPADLQRVAGLPSRAAAVRMFDALFAEGAA